MYERCSTSCVIRDLEIKTVTYRGPCLAQLEDHATLDLKVVSLSPMLDVEMT